jgi:hypothetical protein
MTFAIGDTVKRTDYHNDGKVYTIDQVREWNGALLYHMVGQGWAQGWAWVAGWNIEKV